MVQFFSCSEGKATCTRSSLLNLFNKAYRITQESNLYRKTCVLVRTLPVSQKDRYTLRKGKAMKNNFVMTNTAVREHSGMQMSHSKPFFFKRFFNHIAHLVGTTRDSFQWKNDTMSRVSKAAKEKQLDFNRILLQWDTENSWNETKMAYFILFLTFIEGTPECHISIRLLYSIQSFY